MLGMTPKATMRAVAKVVGVSGEEGMWQAEVVGFEEGGCVGDTQLGNAW
jgi:hypothetical protein